MDSTHDAITRPLRSVPRPKQARSEQTLRRLLDAAESLIEERGFAAASIADIARRARSSVGGFYGRFRDKDQLLLALHERFVGELQERIDAIERSLDPDSTLVDLLRPGLALLVRTYQDRHALLVAFAARTPHSQELRQSGLAFRGAVVARFAELILRWRDDLAHPNPTLAAELSVQLALGFMDQALTVGRLYAGGEPLPAGRLEEELLRAMCGYLGVDPRDATQLGSENQPGVPIGRD